MTTEKHHKPAQAADFAGEDVEKLASIAVGRDFRVQPANSEVESRSKRLREAVSRAGGNKAVAERAGISGSTLGAYLNGQDWKVSTTLQLAEACSVDFNWLVTGEDPPAADPPEPRPEPPKGPPPGLFETVERTRLAAAIDYVDTALRRSGAKVSSIERATGYLLAYDLGHSGRE